MQNFHISSEGSVTPNAILVTFILRKLILKKMSKNCEKLFILLSYLVNGEAGFIFGEKKQLVRHTTKRHNTDKGCIKCPVK